MGSKNIVRIVSTVSSISLKRTEHTWICLARLLALAFIYCIYSLSGDAGNWTQHLAYAKQGLCCPITLTCIHLPGGQLGDVGWGQAMLEDTCFAVTYPFAYCYFCTIGRVWVFRKRAGWRRQRQQTATGIPLDRAVHGEFPGWLAPAPRPLASFLTSLVLCLHFNFHLVEIYPGVR